jgi:PAS domain S-box-containing protein
MPEAMTDEKLRSGLATSLAEPPTAGVRPCVLLIEEDADLRQYHRRLLEDAGYDVLPVSGDQAVDADFSQRNPNIILTDMIGRRDRLDSVSTLGLPDAGLEEVPVIALEPGEGHAAQAACLGGDAIDYVVVPGPAQDLLSRVAFRLAMAEKRATEKAAVSHLHALSCRLTAFPNLQNLLDEVLTATILLQSADFGTIQLYHPETRSLHLVAQFGFGPAFLDHFRVVPVEGGSSCARALKDGKRLVVLDVSLDTNFEPHRQVMSDAEVRAVQSTPLIERSSGNPVGMLSTHFRSPSPPTLRDLQATDLYALQAADVIALRIAEQRLRESEARMQAAVDLVGLRLYSWDPQTGALNWDTTIRAMWGLPPDAGVDHSVFLTGIHPDDRPLVDAAIAGTINPDGDGLYAAEYRVLGIQDGIERWISAKGKTLFEAGKPVRHIGAVLEITERKRAEEHSIASEERLRAALVASATGTWRWNIRTGAVECDEALDRLFGLPTGQTIRNLEEALTYVHPEDRSELAKRADKCAKEGADFEMEFRFTRPDGREIWIYDRGKTSRDSEGRPSYMAGACVDVTERKHAREVLQESEDRFRRFAEHSTGVLRIIDLATMRHAFISSAFEGIWGRTINTTWNTRDWIETVHSDDRKRVQNAFDRVRQGDGVRLEYRIVRPDGGVRRIRDTLFSIRDKQGGVGSVGSSAHDITTHKDSPIYLVDANPSSQRETAEILQGAGYDLKIFASARSFLRLASVLVPGCVVVDIRHAEAGDMLIPLELQPRRRELPVVILGGFCEDLRLGVRAMKAGAADFLPAPLKPKDLLMAVASEVADIREVIEHDRDVESTRAGIALMSLRERQVLNGTLGGGTSKSIAKELGISPRTVEMHRARAMERLGAKSQSELVLLAAAAGLRPSHAGRDPSEGTG